MKSNANLKALARENLIGKWPIAVIVSVVA